MRNRFDILSDLIKLNKSPIELKHELDEYPWDVKEPMVVLKKGDFLKLLEKCIIGGISFKELEDWANVVECRDDIGFEYDEIQEIVFELANQEINGTITKDRLEEIALQLLLS